jgi:murein DD-endopeptidase MepM/ murein hydrolase activator NlpD
VTDRPARVRRVIGRALLVPVLLAPSVVAPTTVSHAHGKTVDATPPAERPAARGSRIDRSTPPRITMSAKRGAKVKPAERPAGCTHTVRRGESVGVIAARYQVPRAAVVVANHLADPHTLRTGQRLAIPGCRPPAPTAKDEPTVVSASGSVLKRVGPLRVLTELVLAQPDFRDERIALAWPIEGPVISTFGRRTRGWHAGIDISAELGSPILAAAAGTVVFSGWIRAYGQIVKIQHSGDFITLYAHNTKNMVEEGESVEAGQVIATVGRSGDASGPHVHFEVRRNGKAYNPLYMLEPSEQAAIFEDDVAASSSDLDSHE